MIDLSPAMRAALRRRIGLSEIDVDLVATVLAAELDPSRGAIRVDTLVASRGPEDAARIIERLEPDRPLRAKALIEIHGDGPFARRTLQLDAGFWPHLVGVVPGRGLAPAPRGPSLDRLHLDQDVRRRAEAAARWLRQQPAAALVIVGPMGSGRGGLANAIAAESGWPVIACTADTLAGHGAPALARDAAWHEAAIVITDAAARDVAGLLALGPLAANPIVITTELAGLAAAVVRSGRAVYTFTVQALDPSVRSALWQRRLRVEAGVDLGRIAHRFGFGPAGIEVVAELASARASAEGRPHPDETDIIETCRSMIDIDLAGFADRLPTTYRRDDLVLTAATRRELDMVETWLAQAITLFGPGGAGARATRGAGMTALFHGPPGTGKTMAAQVIAASAGCDLLRVDLAGIVDKYLGETEKRLDRLFDIATAAGAILFFDEADALFGKRTEVTEARDRYANLGTSYLLQRLEQHRGLSILASNAVQSFDPAFMRRFQILAEFAMPGVAERRAIWHRHLPESRGTEIDVDFLASRLPLAGGDIRNAVFTAVLMAGGERTTLGMPHLLTAVWRELRKAGRLIDESTLGAWRPAVMGRVAAVP